MAEQEQHQDTPASAYVSVRCAYRWGQGCNDNASGMHSCDNKVSVLEGEKRNYNARTALCSFHACGCDNKATFPQEVTVVYPASRSL